MTLTTLLTILQQGEYDTQRMAKWYHQHASEDLQLLPSVWTPKLRLIHFLARIFFFLPLVPRLTLATKLTTPGEYLLRQKAYNQAQSQLNSAKKAGLQVVAIAGSYGKTSTKNILGYTLNLPDHQVLMTPKSVNTLLGISQIIDQELKPEHKLFIVELGEYHPQDIPQLLQFIQPHWGILTPIGVQHLEILGGFDHILATLKKFVEYFQAHPEHLLVAAKNRAYYPELSLQSYGTAPEDQLQLTQVQVSRAGTEYAIEDHSQQTSFSAFTPLLGAHQALNSLPALWLAQQLGLSPESVIKKLRTMPFINRRHEPTFADHNVLILDNSYNTNVDSIKDSLLLLNQLQPSRRIIITLGFTELGDQAEKLHFELGQQLASTVDYVGLIQAPWTDAIKRGFITAGGQADHVVVGESQEAAFDQLKSAIIPNSVILFEGGYQEVYV